MSRILVGWSTERGFGFYDPESGIRVKYDIESGITVKIWRYQGLKPGAKETQNTEWERGYYIWLKESCPERWRELAEWHATEHKLLSLLDNGIEVNIENLRRVSSFSPICSTRELQETMLAEPSLEKLEAAIEVAKEYFKKLEEKQSP